MAAHLRLAVTADLHWGLRKSGDDATALLVEFLRVEPPDVLVIAGDIGSGSHFGSALALFDSLACVKALVPGNHDIWVEEADGRGDSLQVYREYLPRLAAEHGFHYLDQKPLLFPDAGLGLVGSINWYDYSWALDLLKAHVSDWEERLRNKRFIRGRHNDARFVRWPLDDTQFTQQVANAFANQLRAALDQTEQVVAITHHPPFQGLSFPRPLQPPTVDGLLWEAFSGNRLLEEILARHQDRIPFAFCGHTHRERENQLGPIHGFNIGGDYHFKRLLLLDWPGGTVEPRIFREP